MGSLVKYFYCTSIKIYPYKILISICFIITALSCNSVEPTNGLRIELEDVSCTEAWINVTGETGSEIILNRDDKEVQRVTLISVPQIVYDDSLLPNKTYTYQVSYIQNQASSNQLQVTTLDTTSHNFSWEKFYFGNGGSSFFNDAAIISENNIWVVGEIYANDSLGNPDPNVYNAVYWDGQKWELKRITVNFRGNLIAPPLEGVFPFSNTDIWFVGSLPIHGDGENWEIYDLRTTLDPNISLSKAWGTNSNDIYFVGRSGSIARYQNGSWQKIESGTDLSIIDINGSINLFTEKTEVICVAAEFFEDRGVGVIKINENNTTELLDNTGLVRFITSIWFKPDIKYYIVGNGLYERKQDTTAWVDLNNNRIITPNLMGSIRGNGLNDLMVVGAFGEVIHFNGVTWKSIKNEDTSIADYSTVAVKGNLVVAVGDDGNQGVILLGHHQGTGL